MSNLRRKIFIGSTSHDLREHRLKVREVVEKLSDRFEPITMDVEFGAANHPDAVRISLENLDEADIYIGIFAFRYGYIPEGENPESISITEMEFRRASERGIPRFCFLAEDHDSWPVDKIEIDTIAKQKLEALRNTISTELIFGHFSSDPNSIVGTIWHTLNKIKDIHEVPYVTFSMTQQELEDMWQLDDGWLQNMDAQFSLKGKIENLKLSMQQQVSLDQLKLSYGTERSMWKPLAYVGKGVDDGSITNILLEIAGNINAQYKSKNQEIQLRDYSDQFFSSKPGIRNNLLPQLERGCIFIIDAISLFHPFIQRHLRDSDWLISRQNTSVIVALPFGISSQPVNNILLNEFNEKMTGTRHRFHEYLDTLCEIGVTELIQFKRLFSSMLPQIVEMRNAQMPLSNNISIVRQYGDKNNLSTSNAANLIFGGKL